jgi:hypothetical protein
MVVDDTGARTVDDGQGGAEGELDVVVPIQGADVEEAHTMENLGRAGKVQGERMAEAPAPARTALHAVVEEDHGGVADKTVEESVIGVHLPGGAADDERCVPASAEHSMGLHVGEETAGARDHVIIQEQDERSLRFIDETIADARQAKARKPADAQACSGAGPCVAGRAGRRAAIGSVNPHEHLERKAVLRRQGRDAPGEGFGTEPGGDEHGEVHNVVIGRWVWNGRRSRAEKTPGSGDFVWFPGRRKPGRRGGGAPGMFEIKHIERRRQERVALTRPVKVYHAESGRYFSGYTRDVSGGGVLLMIEAPRAIEPGENLEVHIAWDDRSLLRRSEAAWGKVVRVLRTDTPRQYVAVEFECAHALTTRIAA